MTCWHKLLTPHKLNFRVCLMDIGRSVSRVGMVQTSLPVQLDLGSRSVLEWFCRYLNKLEICEDVIVTMDLLLHLVETYSPPRWTVSFL